MLCQFERLIYPHDVSTAANGQYMVAVYNPCENVKDSTGNIVTQVKAVGYCLPTADNIRYDIQGHWSKNSKHGIQFEVENYDEVITHTKEGIIGYLSSGQIKGIGPKVAEKIYNAFGNDSLDVLDKEPEKLLQVSGISQNKLKKIYNSYLANRGARDIIAFLMPHGITANKAIKFYQHYKEKTMNIVRNHPYQLCEISGIGFIEADKIAMSFGLSKTSTERADQALVYTLMNAEKDGHICMEKHKFISECQKLLNTPELTEQMLANRASKLVYTGRLVSYAGFVYRSEMAKTESDLAYQIIKRKRNVRVPSYTHIDKDIDETEIKFNVTFAAEQREAIKAALTNGVSIITGGPGTGKTMIQKAIIEIYRKNNSDKDIKCCAPTGRAARRMTESTGFDASTIHKALNLFADDSGNYSEPELLDADFVIVDEVSMLDIHIAEMLFDALKHNCQIVLIGDSEQLPSVGPGAVLSEMIESRCVSTVRLDTVFRQNSGSRIAVNARLIRHGDHELEYGDDFEFINSPNLEESAKIMVDTYIRETSKYGIDNVALLTPFRKKTATGVNSINESVREIINPGAGGITFRNQSYRHGDKVMQIKNREDVNNGDIGYITDISKVGNDTTVSIDFGGGKIKEYDINDMDQIDLGYASTIHKSQGSEYKSVIINIQNAHYIMLNRPLIYTAITRSKEKVIIIGDKKALHMAISKSEINRRGTCLAMRLIELSK